MMKLSTDLLFGHAGIDGTVIGVSVTQQPPGPSVHLHVDNRGWVGVKLMDSSEPFNYDDPEWADFTGVLTMVGLTRNVMMKFEHGQCYQVNLLTASRKQRLMAFFSQDQHHITVRKDDELETLANRFHRYRSKRTQSHLQRLKWLKRHMTHGEAKSLVKAIYALDSNKTLIYRVTPKYAADKCTQVGAFVV